MMRSRHSRTALLAALLCLAACGNSTLSRTIYTNPPDASVFINGERVQKGTSMNHEFDFSKTPRVLVQATSPDYEPFEQYYTKRQIAALIRSNTKLRIELRQR